MAFYVNSTVKLNMPKLNALSRTAVTALEQTTDALLSEVKNAQVVPFDTGNLQNESTFPDYSKSAQGVTSLVSTAPYARRLYYHPEFNFSKLENKNARGKWFEPWLAGGPRQNFCHDAFMEFYRRLNGL